MNDLNAVKRELQENQQLYERLIAELGRVEQINPVPRGTLATGTSDALTDRNDADNLDSALRKVTSILSVHTPSWFTGGSGQGSTHSRSAENGMQ